MAGYIGGKVAVSAPQQIETKHTITATASQTSIPNVGYTVGAVHVYQNGIRLVDGTDYTATNGSTVTLETGATEGDQIVIVSHGSFETADTVSKASGGTFSGNVSFGDNNKAIFGAGSDLQIYHDGGTSFIEDAGTGNLQIKTNGAEIDLFAGSDYMMRAFKDGAVSLYYDNAAKLSTTATGIDVTGAITVGGAALGSGGMEFIASSGAISNAASVSFTQFDASKYDHYIFKFMYVIPVNDNVAIQGFVSTDGGSNYDTTNGNYHYAGNTDTDGYFITPSYYVGSDTNEYGMCGDFTLFGPHLTNYTYAWTDGMVQDNAGSIRYQEQGLIHLVAADVDAIKFQFSSGNIESGEIVMYGIANGT